jgi:hypothetical protein
VKRAGSRHTVPVEAAEYPGGFGNMSESVPMMSISFTICKTGVKGFNLVRALPDMVGLLVQADLRFLYPLLRLRLRGRKPQQRCTPSKSWLC